ncbi:hypothetical protein WQQ_34630 [Hydrocarboniphaga effusa AP103]|uniref:Uncharacterized protein n=1 Tax=Hydrocarboniphaga effusa AP103 TaxID=1172194 RepID=I8T3H5_9GAMM|nr:hypothetical protein WQQ_34630 [Hydrocarboniphaga effusa AP103]
MSITTIDRPSPLPLAGEGNQVRISNPRAEKTPKTCARSTSKPASPRCSRSSMTSSSALRP